MKGRLALRWYASCALPLLLAACAQPPLRATGTPEASGFTVEGATISEMQSAMTEGRTSARQLVVRYLSRIRNRADTLNALLYLNPHALQEADRLDDERRRGIVRGPLHGIPVALKDTIQTADMPTTGGALAFAGFVPRTDAALVENLRSAGAILLAKTNLTELSNAVSWSMPAGYSALGGQGSNPHDAALSPGGSSSGAGVAADLWAAAIGAETDGSIGAPSIANLLVGLRPTHGRVSQQGLMPWMRERDTAGPIAKTVEDAALLLEAIEDRGNGPGKASACPALSAQVLAQALRDGNLAGIRVGVPRAYFYEPIELPGHSGAQGGLESGAMQRMREAMDALVELRAAIVDPVEIRAATTERAADHLMSFRPCLNPGELHDPAAHCSIVYHYALKRDLDRWLLSLGADAPVESLAGLRRWNEEHREDALRYGQALLDDADSMDLVRDRARFEREYAHQLRIVKRAVDDALRVHRLDALLLPGHSGSTLAAVPGYPAITVPLGRLPERGEPFGLMLIGRACAEPMLIRIAHRLERALRPPSPVSPSPA